MIDLTVKTLDSQNHSFSLEDDITVRGFKEYIAESVAVPADSQRLIYCGRVLQDEKKLNDYDVNGKVIHLVQRAPPQPGQRANGGAQSQNNSQNNARTHRTHYRIIRDTQNAHTGPNAQVHGNAMYLGAMTLPTEVVEGHGIPVPQLSNTLSNSRMVMAKRMLTNANRIMDRLDNPNSTESESSGTERLPTSTPPDSSDNNMDTSRPESSQEESTGPTFMAQEDTIELEPEISEPNRNLFNQQMLNVDYEEVARMEEALRGAVTDTVSMSRLHNATTGAEDDTDIHEVEVSTSNDTPPETASQHQPRESFSSEEPRISERPRTTPTLPRPPQMADLLEMLMNTQDRLRPYLEHYRVLMATDPVLLPTGTGVESISENQHVVDEVSRILHYISHACHALSDIIVDMGQAPPRNLSCRPIIIQQSAILQAGIPIQLEAHISMHGRNSAQNNNNNNTTEENSSTATAPIVSEGAESEEIPAGERPQQNPASNEEQNPNQQSPDQQPPDQQRPDQQPPDQQRLDQQRPDQHQRSDQQQRPDQQQQQSQTPFGNLLSSMFNLPSNVEVLMEVSPDSSMDLNSSDDQSPNNGANNNNNPGNMSRGASGIFPWGAAPPADFIRNLMHAVAGHIVQDPVNMTTNQPSNAATVTINQQTIGTGIDGNAQNSSQSTQARNNVGTHPTTSTQTRSTSRPHVFHSQGVGLGQGLCADPFLPCNSHHLRRSSTTGANATRQSSVPQNQTGFQISSESSAANNSTNVSSSTWYINGNSYLDDLRAGLGNRRFRQHREGLSNSLSNLVKTLSSGRIGVRFSEETLAPASGVTLAELLENREDVNTLSNHVFNWGGDYFLLDFSVFFVHNMTLEGFVGLRFGHYGAISNLRRPLREFLQRFFGQTSSNAVIQEQIIERLINRLKPHLVNILTAEKDTNNRSIAWVEIVKTVETLFRRHFSNLLKLIFDDDLDDTRFCQEIISVLNNFGTQVCNVLRYLVMGGQVGLNKVIQRLMTAVVEFLHPSLHRWALNNFLTQFRVYSTQVSQLPNSEILTLLVYETPKRSSVSESSESSESSETDTVEVDFTGREMLPPDWVPVIARDAVRQRRLAQGISTGGAPTFSDAYLGCLPRKRRKIIQQEKPQILFNPTSNPSTITASIERLVKDSVSRAGVAEVEGAAAAVANDPGVRNSFGQAIRDSLQPQRFRTPDFPDSLRFPNATKFFHQDRPPKQ